MNNIICYLQQNPGHGFLGSVIGFVLGFAPKIEPSTYDFVTFLFQNTAFAVTICLGIVTLYAQWKNKKSKNKNCK